MIITLHQYVTDPGLPQRDGVNLAHENITAIMKGYAGNKFKVLFHDFNRLLRDENYAVEVLGSADCVSSNIGPHAHYYFYLRERHRLRYRIFRDVRTAIWSSYLLQEHLCAPYLRTEDTLMVASHYTRGLYESIFPHLKNHSIFRCYPLAVNFPKNLPDRRVRGGEDPIVLGYIGRLSEDKNFPDLVRLLIELNRSRPGKYKLLACGDIHSSNCTPELIQFGIQEALGDGDYFEYLPSRRNEEVWELLRRFDIMLFPSTSNLETFGRVLVEASYAGVPVVCAAHAAAPELMPESSLCSVAYQMEESFSAHFDHRMGKVNIWQMADVITSGRLQLPDCHCDFLQHPEKFRCALTMNSQEISKLDPLTLKDTQLRLIESITVDMPPALAIEAANLTIERMIPWFCGLQKKGAGEQRALVSRLADISVYPERTGQYIEKSNKTRGDFTNVGGIDIELCHVVDFFPIFSMTSSVNECGPEGLPVGVEPMADLPEEGRKLGGEVSFLS